MIKETKNHEMFKKHASNRPLVEENVKKIMKSIEIKNLLEYRPLLVDEDFYVIDGQHRLEAAKRLNISVWYQTEKKSDVTDMFLLNANQRKWFAEDYLNFYCSEGNQNYIKLREFLKKNSILLRQAIKLFGKYKTTEMHSKHLYKAFNEGRFTYVDPIEERESLEMLEKVKRTVEFIAVKLPGQNLFLNTTKFMMSLIDFFILYPIEYDEFMKKLSIKLELIRPCSNKNQYLEIFKAIYNFRNHNPITD
jgi:hypothetical protein